MEIRIITHPPNKSAREMFFEISNWFRKQEFNLSVRCVKMKSNPKIKSQKDDDSSFFWNKKLQGASSNMYSDSKIISQYSARLLYEEDSFLAKQLDYCQFIQNVLIQPQEELFGVPTWQPTPREADKQKDKIYSECVIYISGFDILKLKGYEEGKQQKMNLFGKECQLKLPQKRIKDLKIRSGHRIKGSEIMFGFMSSKFYQYWSSNQISKYYQQILLEEIVLELDELNVNVYFTVCIDNCVRINCKISFNTIRLGAQKQVDGNQTYQNGGMIVEKGKDRNTLIFYIKIYDPPKCYIYCNEEKDVYKQPQELKYWRCQNFLSNSMMNYIHNGIVRQFSYMRLVVNHDQTKNSDFLRFCQLIEEQGYLNKYNNEQSIPVKKFTDFSVNPYVLENIKLCLNWMLVSCCLGRFKILSIFFNFQSFIENVKEIQANTVAEHINILRKRKYEKNDREPFQPDKFLDIVSKNSNKHPEVTFEDLLQADLTPSGLIPNYSIQEYFPIQNTEIVNRKQIKGKFQQKQSKIDQELIKVRIRDENWETLKSHFFNFTISYKESTQAPQNKLLFHSFFRSYLKGNFNVLQRRYSFFGFDCRSLRKGEFYIINSSLYQPAMKYMFLQLSKVYKNDQSVVKCSQIQQILNENFNQMIAMVSLDDIQLKLLENHFEPQTQTIQVRGPLLQVKTRSKIPNREKNKDNNYNYKVLMPQGKVTQDIMKIINEIAFPDEKTDYCCFIIRYKNMKGIITKKHNSNKFGTITLYENMKQKYSSITELFDNIEQPIRIDNKNISDIQILGIPLYKQCKLSVFHILNIVSLDKTKKSLHRMKSILKQHFQKSEQEIVIDDGAYLMGVYDSRLEPDEIFIQIQTNQETKVIQGEQIMIFKKNYLREDGIHIFQNVDTQKQQQLASIYKNVIVFSAHMICSKFAFDQFDDKQKFFAVWDQELIPEKFQISTMDGKESYKKLKFNNRDKNASQAESSKFLNSSILDSQEINNEWLDGLKHQIIDYFCFFQCGTNFQELSNLYTKLMFVKILFPGGDQDNYQTIADTIKAMNLIYLWFSHCQALQTSFDKQLKPFLHDLNKQIIDIIAETRKLFQV